MQNTKKEENLSQGLSRKKIKKAISRTFSKEDLKCVSLDGDRIECIDPQFGIFKL